MGGAEQPLVGVACLEVRQPAAAGAPDFTPVGGHNAAILGAGGRLAVGQEHILRLPRRVLLAPA